MPVDVERVSIGLTSVLVGEDYLEDVALANPFPGFRQDREPAIPVGHLHRQPGLPPVCGLPLLQPRCYPVQSLGSFAGVVRQYGNGQAEALVIEHDVGGRQDQPGNLYRDVMTDHDRESLVGNIVEHLKGAQKRIQLRQAALFLKVDADYGAQVATGLGLDLEEVERLASMSQEDRVKATS